MNERFFALPSTRRNAIINAGFETFSSYPYSKAPMSEVASAGGVSKPLLFHYFKNKLGLYLFLWEIALDALKCSIKDADVFASDNLFEILRRATSAKCTVMRSHPRLFAFATRAYYEEEPSVKAAIEKQVDEALSIAANSLSHLKDTGLREGLCAMDIYNDFLLLSEGYVMQRYRTDNIDVDAIERDFNAIINRWQAAFAKEGAR